MAILREFIQDIFCHLLNRLKENCQGAPDLFKLLYSWLHVEGQMDEDSILDLKARGLLFKDSGD